MQHGLGWGVQRLAAETETHVTEGTEPTGFPLPSSALRLPPLTQIQTQRKE